MLITAAAIVILFCIGVPVAFALGAATTVGLIADGSIPLMVVPQRLFTSVSVSTLMAIPFFILAGNLMAFGGMSKRIVDFAMSCIGRKTGGLAMVTIVAVMFFSALSGSSSATAAAIGIIMIPEMIKYNYDRGFAAGTVAASAELGIIIPPSTGMILFGVATGTSIGTLFIAGIGPGLFIGLSLVAVARFRCRKAGYQGIPKDVRLPAKGTAFRRAFLALLMPIIILGGIYGGVFTATEAAAVAVAYGFFIGFFVYKEIAVKDFREIFINSILATTTVMMIIANASLFGWVLAREQIPNKVANAFINFSDQPLVFLILVNVLLFLVGMIFEASPAILILAPILTPVAALYGIDPVMFGVIMVINLAVGMVTPPVGLNLYVTCSIAELTIEKLSKHVLPYLAILILDVLLISYIPIISLGLPRLLGML